MHAREQRTGATGKPAGQAGQAGQAGRARSGRPAPAGPAPGVPAADRPPDLLDLQRLAGNAAVSRALRQRGDRDAPSARQQRRGDQRVPVQQGDQRISVQRDDQRIPVQQGDQHIPVQQGDQRIPVQRGGGRAWGGAARYAEQPVEHPEWPLFRSLMRQAGFDQDTLEAVWQLLMGGIRQQEEVEKSLDDAHLSRSERRSRRSGNDWYRQVIDMVGDHLRIDTPTMGLWSGGLDVNDYASAKGHTTLEHSNLGRVINSLELHPGFSLIGPLWNLLSVSFVRRATGPVHVFIRAHDPDSVLQDQEIPQLRALQSMGGRAGRDISLVWHPLYTTADGTIREISPDLRLVDDAPYRQRDLCVAALYGYLLRLHDPGNPNSGRAYDEMHSRLARDGHRI